MQFLSSCRDRASFEGHVNRESGHLCKWAQRLEPFQIRSRCKSLIKRQNEGIMNFKAQKAPRESLEKHAIWHLQEE